MSYSYYARFSPSQLDVDDFLVGLEQVMELNRITFTGEIALLKPHNGCPSLDRFIDKKIKKISDLKPYIESHWGVGLSCISQYLASELERSIAIEVDFQVCRDTKGQFAIDYSESSRAFNFRESDLEAVEALTKLQKIMCSSLKLDFSIYAEEDDYKPCLPGLERIITQVKQQYHLHDFSAVIKVSLLDDVTLNLLKKKQGDKQIRETVDGYICVSYIYKDH